MANQESPQASAASDGRGAGGAEPRRPGLRLSGEALWKAFTTVPGVGISVVTAEGQVVYANQQAEDLFGVAESRGKTLRQLFPEEFVRERQAIIDHIVESGRCVLVRHMMHGRRLESAIRRIDGEEGEAPRLLVITRRGTSDSTGGGCDVFESQYIDLGELEVLTPRELEVLALIGQGLRLGEIADLLHRSRKTIEKHKASIAEKLGLTSPASLARVATEAGLELHHAHLKRLRDGIAEESDEDAPPAGNSQRR